MSASKRQNWAKVSLADITASVRSYLPARTPPSRTVSDRLKVKSIPAPSAELAANLRYSESHGNTVWNGAHASCERLAAHLT